MSDIQRLWPAVPLAAAAILAGASAFANGNRNGNDNGDEEETPFDEARLFFELNDTDGDLGIHSLIDGDAWKRLEIDDPNDVRMLDVFVRGRLRKQGLTEVFFESAEPPFDELAPEKFFKRFPEGVYDFSGLTLEGQELDSEVTLSHVLAAPPENIRISDVPAAENCDADPLPSVSAPVTISWDAVTQSHPRSANRVPSKSSTTSSCSSARNRRCWCSAWSCRLISPQFTIPDDFIALGDAFKFEIIVKATNGNQTAVESCFEIAAD